MNSLEWTREAVNRFITRVGATAAEVASSYCDIAGYTPDADALAADLDRLVARGELRVDGERYFDPLFDSD